MENMPLLLFKRWIIHKEEITMQGLCIVNVSNFLDLVFNFFPSLALYKSQVPFYLCGRFLHDHGFRRSLSFSPTSARELRGTISAVNTGLKQCNYLVGLLLLHGSTLAILGSIGSRRLLVAGIAILNVGLGLGGVYGEVSEGLSREYPPHLGHLSLFLLVTYIADVVHKRYAPPIQTRARPQ